jgi:ABC-type sugar transport system ATPase subunit
LIEALGRRATSWDQFPHGFVTEILSTYRISKRFGAVAALRDVSFDLKGGEIRALVGENGAGKSTFVKILMGIHRADSGTVRIDGSVRDIRSPQEAQSFGLALVAQELSLAPHLSVLDNIWLGSRRVPLFHRRRALRDEARAALGLLGTEDFDLDQPVARLSVGQRQIVEIARMMARDAQILILDEPTATLSDIEIGRIFAALKALRARGRSVLYITHRLGEVFDICDTVSVFRNCEHVATQDVGAIDRDGLIELMLGRSFSEMYPAAPVRPPAAAALTVTNLSVPGAIDAFSMTVPKGKILCLAGQSGSGASSVIRALAGLEPEATGSVAVNGTPLALGSPAAARTRGMLYISDDRGGEGIFPNLSVLDNLVATRLVPHARLGVLSWRALRVTGGHLAERVNIDRLRLRSAAIDLSGGNQQKLLFGRGLERGRTGVLVMNEPTRGVDVGARIEIYRLMREFCAAGYALVMTSSDLEEVVGMADIIITLYRGRAIARYEGTDIAMRPILADIIHPSTATVVA